MVVVVVCGVGVGVMRNNSQSPCQTKKLLLSSTLGFGVLGFDLLVGVEMCV
jgi:hypothetical protein